MTKSEQARVNILFYLKSVAIGSPVSDELRDILIEEANKVPKSYWHKIEPYTEGSIYGMVIAALVSNSGENLYEFVKTIAKYFDWDDIVPFTSDRGIDLILKITSPFKIGIVQEIFEHSNDAVRKKIAQYAFKHFGQNVDFCNYLAEKMGYQPQVQTDGLPIFNAEKLANEAKQEASEKRNRMLVKIYKTGNIRSIGGMNVTVKAVDDLRHKFPNMSEVIDDVICRINLQKLSTNKMLRIPPMILLGTPGVGKTKFVRELCKAINVEYHYIPCNNATAGFIFSGSDPTWNEARPGSIVMSLINGKTINPVLMLDEVDKMKGSSNYDPSTSLTQLLETETANEFQDEYLKVPVDCSYIQWIATANDLSSMPEHIKTRFKVFDIPEPTLEQMPLIAQSVYSDLLNKNKDSWGSKFNNVLPQETLDAIVSYTPRVMSKILETACAKAAEEFIALGVDFSEPLMLKPEYLGEQKAPPKKNPIGFAPSPSI